LIKKVEYLEKGKVEDASKVNKFALAHACFENSCVRGPK
jgi:hypothetical protein